MALVNFLLVFLNFFLLLRGILDVTFQTRKEKLMFNKWFLHWWWVSVFNQILQTIKIMQVEKRVRRWHHFKFTWKYANFISSHKKFQVGFSSKGTFQTGNIKEEKEVFKNINQVSYKKTWIWSLKNKKQLFLKSDTYMKKHILVLHNQRFLICSERTIGRFSTL